MKKTNAFFRVLIVLLFGTTFTFAQTGSLCTANLHQVFGSNPGTEPVLLMKLGTRPQFGEIPKHTAAAAYSHLNMVYGKNIRNSKGEIDNLLRSIGYTGLKDKSFGPSKITPVFIPKGTTGWMGAYTIGHQYKWSVLGRDFESFKITSADGTCHVYIMKKCGNGFYDPGPRDQALALLAAKNAENAKPKVTCVTQTIVATGNSKIMGGDVLNKKSDIPVVATYNGQSVSLGSINANLRSTYDFGASADASYSKSVLVCDYGNGVVPNQTLNLPIQLGFDVTGTDVSFGEDGKLSMAVSKKRFKALKKAYGSSALASSGTSSSTLKASSKSGATEATVNSSPSVSGTKGECIKQTINYNGNNVIEDNSVKSSSAPVTVIGVYNKLGKLTKGESSAKYLCLGSYTVPTKSTLSYKLSANSSLSKIIEVCDNGSGVSPEENISVPLNVKSNFSKQDVTVGDYGNMYVNLTSKQYKALSKKFSRCCSNGNTKGCY
jgi:hypothetical protein